MIEVKTDERKMARKEMIAVGQLVGRVWPGPWRESEAGGGAAPTRELDYHLKMLYLLYPCKYMCDWY